MPYKTIKTQTAKCASRKYLSQHFEDKNIAVEFVVLHYTAQSFKETLNIFFGSLPVSCHLLIDRPGTVYELVNCWKGECKKAFHSGQSVYIDKNQKRWEGFNNISIGIELVNWNGNLFDYTKQQYESLCEVLQHLKKQYPNLQDPDRVLGHEHIAGFRGKKDPGALFDWQKLYKQVYGMDYTNSSQKNKTMQNKEEQNNTSVFKHSASDFKKVEIQKTRWSVLTKKQLSSLAFLKNKKAWNDKKARKISLILENTLYPFWLKKILIYFSFSFKNKLDIFSTKN